MLKPTRTAPSCWPQVEAAWRAPSLYDEALRLLARRGLDVPADHLERDWSKPYEASDGVEQAWLVVYRDPSSTGTSTSSARNSPTSKTPSASGASAT